MQQFFLGISIFLSLGTAGWANGPLDTEGQFALGTTDRLAGADLYLAGDGTTRLSFDSFGLELGIYGRADALDTPHETYGALYFDTVQAGRISVGNPRPAYDGVARSSLDRAFPSLAVDRAAATRSATTTGALTGGWVPWGARIENQTGNTSYAISAHYSQANDTTVIGIGAQTDLDRWRLSAAVEHSGTTTRAKGMAAVNYGAISGTSLAYFTPGLTGEPDFIEANLVFHPAENWTLTALGQAPVNGQTDPTTGLSVQFAVNDRVSVTLGGVSDRGAAAVYEAFLGLRF